MGGLTRRAALQALAAGAAGPAFAQAPAAPFVDAHLHPPRARRRREIGEAVAIRQLLDQFGIERAILAPPPFLADSPGRFGAGDLKSWAKSDARLAFVAGGESLNPILQGTSAGKVGPDLERRFRDQAQRLLRAGALGFGEMAVEHFSANRGAHPYESTRADHPLLLALAEVAGREGAPVEIHMEAVPEDMPFPPIGIAGGRNPERLRANIPAFETLLDHARQAPIVWLHAGWDSTDERTPALMRRLLAAHANLFMSIKLDPNGRQLTAPMTPDGALKAGWLAMLRAWPDRFFIGSDQFAGEEKKRLEGARALLAALPADLQAPVGRLNARRLYRLS